MTYIRTIPESEAEGKLRDLYAKPLAKQGYVSNHMKAMSLRPDAIEAWQQLIVVIRSKMELRPVRRGGSRAGFVRVDPQ